MGQSRLTEQPPPSKPSRAPDSASPRGDTPRSRLGSRLLHFDRIDSTNDHLKRRAAELPDGAVTLAEFQTGGRGRMGRRWIAPPGSSLMLSVLLVEPGDSPLLTWAGMLACVAACEAIESSTSLAPRLRWPNDLMLAGGKVGGVLAESTPLADGKRAVIVGVGVNCLQRPDEFDEALRGAATSLAIESGEPVDRLQLGRALIERMDAWLARTRDGRDIQDLLSQWRRRNADVGRPAVFLHNGAPIEGAIVGVADDGDLLIELGGGERRRLGAATTTRVR
jgi:BirA family biotin operon repressor/biotin-[acetyl-CoA-carboxylase] ligase